MSWYVEGRQYHDYDQYQSALAAYERRQVLLTTDRLASENQRLNTALAEDRRVLSGVQNDLRQQMEISRRVESNVRSMERNQRRLHTMVEQTEARMQESHSRLQRELREQGGKLHGVAVSLETLKRNYEHQVREFHAQIGDVRRDLSAAVANAEVQRRETEERLNATIRAVDAKNERDRAERLRTTNDHLALAAEEAGHARRKLENLDRRAEALGLTAEVQTAKGQLETVSSLVAQKNGTAALTAAMLAHATTDAMQREMDRRELELDVARNEFHARAASIEAHVGEGATEEVKDCFENESEKILCRLSASRERLPERYQNFRTLETDRREDELLLQSLEQESLEISARAPMVVEAASARMEYVDEAMRGLRRAYGNETKRMAMFSRADDPKSDLIVNAEFGATKVEMRFTLDGEASWNGYAHGSNSDVNLALKRVLNDLIHQRTVAPPARVQSQATEPHAQAALTQAGYVQTAQTHEPRVQELLVHHNDANTKTRS